MAVVDHSIADLLNGRDQLPLAGLCGIVMQTRFAAFEGYGGSLYANHSYQQRTNCGRASLAAHPGYLQGYDFQRALS